jgi:hypothetical protein
MEIGTPFGTIDFGGISCRSGIGFGSTDSGSKNIDLYDDADFSEYTVNDQSTDVGDILSTQKSHTIQGSSQGMQIDGGENTPAISSSGLPNYPEPGKPWHIYLGAERGARCYFGSDDPDNAYFLSLQNFSGSVLIGLVKTSGGTQTELDETSVSLTYTDRLLEFRVPRYDLSGITVEVYDGNTKLTTLSSTGLEYREKGFGYAAFQGTTAYADDARLL